MAYVQAGRTGHERDALEIRANFNSEIEKIRANSRLSDQGKTEAIASAWRDAQSKSTALQEAEMSSNQAHIKSLERQLFGLPGSADASESISYRDAQDRVTAIPSDGGEPRAMRLLQQAERSGDRSLAKAVVQRALEERWADVLNAYADEHPGTEAKLQELLDHYVGTSSSQDIARAMGAAMAYNVPKPAEIQYMSDRQVDAFLERVG